MKPLASLCFTGLVSLVGTTAFAHASGSPWNIAACWGIGWACSSLSTHRVIALIVQAAKGA